VTTPDEYNKVDNELLQLDIPQLTEYYNSNWHPCREEWVACYHGMKFNLGLTGTQRIECLHEKVKKVVKRNSEIVCFFECLLTFIEDHEHAVRHRAMDAINRLSVKTKEAT